MKHLPRFIAALAGACSLAHAHAECAPVEVLDPARNSTIHGARPDIRWGGLSGVKVYRVQIESRVPEGQVIERIDTRVGDTRFVPPRPLTDRRAAVKLLVTADCPESTSVATHPAWFFIDMAPKCSAVRGLSLSGEGAPKAEWISANGVTRYEVEAYSMADGRLIVRRETTLSSSDLPRVAAALVIAVRPRCESVVGEAAYGFLPESR
jgi:hypothetical protein